MDRSDQRDSTQQHKLQLIIGGLKSMNHRGVGKLNRPVVDERSPLSPAETLSDSPSILALTPPKLGQGLLIS